MSPLRADDEGKPAGDQEPRYRRQPLGPFAIVSSELYSNRKIRKAGRDGRDVFVFALTRNAARGRTGSLQVSELDPDYIADMLQIDVQAAASGLQRAIASQLLELDGDTVHIVGWDETWARHAISESDARQIRRARSREEGAPDPTKKNEKETQIKKKKSPDIVRTMSGQTEARPRRKPAAALPDAWNPQEADNTLSGKQLENELAKFRDYARANDWRKVDWDATWRNWQRSASERTPHASGGRQRRPGDLIGPANARTDHPESSTLIPISEL